MGKKWRWGVILDAGSSGTRLHVYRWKDPSRAVKDADEDELTNLPKVMTNLGWTKKIRPGVSTFSDKPDEVGPEHLKELVDHALLAIPEDKIRDTPVFLMATAGMRLLPERQQKTLLGEICSYLRQNTDFSLPDCDLHIQVIKGETEGLYGWIATNYLLGGFDRPAEHAHGKGHHTYGFLDMGGASAQIAFAPNATEAEKHANDLKLLRMRTVNGERSEYKVFTATWLGFGVNQAREAYVNNLLEAYDSNAREIPDPCMPKGLRTTLDGKPAKNAAKEQTLVGTGDFNSCLAQTYPLLGKDVPCEDEPCLLNGQHVPAIDFDVNHFIGVSEYWHTTHGVFGAKHDKHDKAYDFHTYQQRVQDFCSKDWEDIAASTLDTRKKKKVDPEVAQQACFKASWLINVLHDGIGIPRIGLEHMPPHNASQGGLEDAKEKGFLDPFQPVDKIDGIEVSWTLGKMLLYAAGQIPPRDGDTLPVGFGSNVDGVPLDFNYAGSSWKPLSGTHDDDDDWSDTAEDVLDHVKVRSRSGFLFFILILFFLAFLLRKKERRMRLLSKLNSLAGRSRRPGGSPRGRPARGISGLAGKLFGRASAQYERVMEEGGGGGGSGSGATGLFELGELEADDNEHSDGSETSRIGRTSGLATPKLNLERFDDLRPASALDRSGLTVRTESRERLVPLSMLGAGRRSRTGSPTRKSALMSPLEEDY